MQSNWKKFVSVMMSAAMLAGQNGMIIQAEESGTERSTQLAAAPETSAPATEAPAPATETPAPATEAPSQATEQPSAPTTEQTQNTDAQSTESATETKGEDTFAFTLKEGVTVTVETAKELPGTTQLIVTQLTKKTPVTKKETKKLVSGEVNRGHRELTDIAAYQLLFMDNGVSVLPEGEVTVTFAYEEGLDLALDPYMQAEAGMLAIDGEKVSELAELELNEDLKVEEATANVELTTDGVIVLAGVENRRPKGEKLTAQVLEKDLEALRSYTVVTENEQKPVSENAAAVVAEEDPKTQSADLLGKPLETNQPTTDAEKTPEKADGDMPTADEDPQDTLADLAKTSLKLADAKDSDKVAVVSVYAKADGTIDFEPLEKVLRKDENGNVTNAIDVTGRYVLINVVTEKADQELTVKEKFTAWSESADTDEIEPESRILWNFITFAENAYKDYKGTATFEEKAVGTMLAPAGSLVLENALVGSVYAKEAEYKKIVDAIFAGEVEVTPAAAKAPAKAPEEEPGTVTEGGEVNGQDKAADGDGDNAGGSNDGDNAGGNAGESNDPAAATTVKLTVEAADAADSNTKLTDAKFSIFKGEDTTAVVADVSAGEWTLDPAVTTEKDATWGPLGEDLAALENNAELTLTIKESTVPSGYIKADDQTITVSKDDKGVLNISGDVTKTLTFASKKINNKLTIYVKDEKGLIADKDATVLVRTTDGKELFRFTDVKGLKEITLDATSDNKDVVDLVNKVLNEGNEYSLVVSQVKAPAGYYLDTDNSSSDVEVKISSKDGSLELAVNGNAANEVTFLNKQYDATKIQAVTVTKKRFVNNVAENVASGTEYKRYFAFFKDAATTQRVSDVAEISIVEGMSTSQVLSCQLPLGSTYFIAETNAQGTAINTATSKVYTRYFVNNEEKNAVTIGKTPDNNPINIVIENREYQIMVTKQVYQGLATISPLQAKEALTYYVGLFADKACTQLVADIPCQQVIIEKGKLSGSVTFSGVLPDKTYYVSEVMQSGDTYVAMKDSDNLTIVYKSNASKDDDPQKVEITKDQVPTDNKITIENRFTVKPENASFTGKFKITKKVVDSNGKAKNVKGSFYAAVFKVGAKQIPANRVGGRTIEFNMRGKSQRSVNITIPINDDAVEYVVVETDSAGTPLKSGKTGYEITYKDSQKITLRADATAMQTVTIINKEIENKETETKKTQVEKATLNFTKKVTYHGKSMKVNATYYIGMWLGANADTSKKPMHIKKITLKDASEGSGDLKVDLGKVNGRKVTFTLAEVDVEGKVLASGKGADYEVNLSPSQVTLSDEHPVDTINVTNAIVKGSKVESALLNPSSGFAGDSGAVSEAQALHSGAASVNSGDSTPLLPLSGAAGASLIVILGAAWALIRRKRRV